MYRNRGRTIHMTYDKRQIINPNCEYEDVVKVDTLPFGHIDLVLLGLDF